MLRQGTARVVIGIVCDICLVVLSVVVLDKWELDVAQAVDLMFIGFAQLCTKTSRWQVISKEFERMIDVDEGEANSEKDSTSDGLSAE